MKKSNFRGLAAVVAVMGILAIMAACGDNGDTGGGSSWGNPPSTLVGTWMTMGASPVLTINANGTGSNAGDPVDSWKVKGNELKMTYQGIESIVKWSVSGNQLTLSYPDDTSTIGMGNLLIAYSPLTKQSGTGGPGGGLSELAGTWESNGSTAFEVTSAGKFIMSDTTYDISVSGNTATLIFGGTTVGTFNYAVNNNQMVIFNGTGIGMTIVALSPLAKRGLDVPAGPVGEDPISVW